MDGTLEGGPYRRFWLLRVYEVLGGAQSLRIPWQKKWKIHVLLRYLNMDIRIKTSIIYIYNYNEF